MFTQTGTGFDSLVLGRMHENYLDLIKNQKLTEFYWDMFGKGNLNKSLLTHIKSLHYGYIMFLQDLEDSPKTVMPQFITKLNEILKEIKHKNILFLFVDDFKYRNDNIFSCMDTIMGKFNER